MRRSTTAVVLSALVLPGAGQLYLKHTRRGLVFIGVSLVCLWLILVQAIQQASVVLVQLQSQGGALDVADIAGLLGQSQGSVESSAASVAVWVLFVCWVASIVDAHRLGKREASRAEPLR